MFQLAKKCKCTNNYIICVELLKEKPASGWFFLISTGFLYVLCSSCTPAHNKYVCFFSDENKYLLLNYVSINLIELMIDQITTYYIIYTTEKKHIILGRHSPSFHSKHTMYDLSQFYWHFENLNRKMGY